MKGIISQAIKKNHLGEEFLTNPTKKAHNWEEVIRSYNCFFCQKNFTEEDIQTKNYQLAYSSVYGVKEIYHVYHLQHRERYPNGVDCNICRKPINNLIMLDEVKRPYHPVCFAQERIIYYRKHDHSQLGNCGCC